MSCPNINSPQWKALVAKIGTFEAFKEFRKYGDVIPDAEKYPESLNGVNATLKVVNALANPIIQGHYKRFYLKGNKDKFFQELTPLAGAHQTNLLREWDQQNPTTNIEDMIEGILAELSYTVKIDTATKYIDSNDAMVEYEIINSDHYSRLTVPGGTNYTEQEIATPGIVPAIKGHAAFATSNGIGWFRSDDRGSNKTIETVDELFDNEPVTTEVFVSDGKTRRILEVQSDLFQKGRELADLNGGKRKIPQDFEVRQNIYGNKDEFPFAVINNEDGEIWDFYKTREEATAAAFANRNPDSRENKFLQLLNRDNNWVTFFIKSIIQDSLRRGYEKVMFPSGNTASKVEGHTTIEEFVAGKRRRVNDLEAEIEEIDDKGSKEYRQVIDDWEYENIYNAPYYTVESNYRNDGKHVVLTVSDSGPDIYDEYDDLEEAAKVAMDLNVKMKKIADEVRATRDETTIIKEAKAKRSREIEQLEKEIDDVQREGMAKLKPIFAFYEGAVTNILKKQYKDSFQQITDEHGNTWNEIALNAERDTSTIMLQKETDAAPKASPKTIAKLREFLKRIGVDARAVESIRVNGQELKVNGIAYPIEKLIEFVNGKEDTVLPEEAMHIAVELIKQTNPSLYKKMAGEIGKYEIFRQVIAEYGNDPLYQKDGKRDVLKLKDEAIGKVLAEYVLHLENDIQEEPKRIAEAQSWWRAIVEALKALFGKAKFNPFVEAAAVIEDQSLTQESFTGTGGPMLQRRRKAPDASADQATAWKNLTETEALMGYDKSDPQNAFYTINGERIKSRVSEKYVKPVYRRHFPNPDALMNALHSFKAEKGTDVHADIQDIIYRHIDDNGDLRETPLPQTNVSQTDPNNNSKYINLEKHVVAVLNSFPDKTKFRAEVKIYDKANDVAGTIDLIAIEKTGKTHLLDWKTMNLNVTEYSDVAFFKKEAFDAQLTAYKNILRENYGIVNFGRTEAIPIITTFKKVGNENKLDTLQIGKADPKNIVEDYLLPVPTSDQMTDDQTVNEYIRKLSSLHKVINARKVDPSRKNLKAEQLNAILRAIRHLQVRKSAAGFVEQGEVFQKEIQATIDEYNALKASGVALTPDQIEDFSNRLDTDIEAFNIYSRAYKLSHLFDTNIDSQKKMLDRLQKLSYNTDKLADELKNTYTDFGVNYIAFRRGIDALDMTEKVVRGWNKMFRTLSQASTKALQTLWLMKEEATNQTDFETDAEVDRLTELQKAYTEWAAAKGLTNKDMFSPLLKKDSHQLIDQYQKAFYDELKIAAENSNEKWIKANVNMTEVLKEAQIRKERELAYLEQQHFAGTEEEQEKRKETKRGQIENKYGKYLMKNYNLLKQFPLDKHYTPEYKSLQQNKPALDFYNYIREWNDKATETDYLSKAVSRNFVPFVRKGMIEKMVFGGKSTLIRNALQSITVNDAEVGYGQINPFTGKIEDSVPIYFTRNMEGEQYSTDLFKVMGIFIHAVVEHKNLSRLESQSRLLLKIEQNKGSLQTNSTGSLVRDPITKEAKKLETNLENSQLLEDFIKSAIYKQKYLNTDAVDILGGRIGEGLSNAGKKINKVLGMKLMPEDLPDGKFSLVKSVESINRLFQMKVLGLNLATGIANYLGANFQAAINAGRFYNRSEFFKAELQMIGHKLMRDNASLHMAMINYFMPLTEGELHNKLKELSTSKITNASFSEFMMVLMRKADHAIQYANFLAMMENAIVDENGQIVNVREYVNNSPEYTNRYNVSAAERKTLEAGFEAKVEELKKSKGVINNSKVVDGKLQISGIEKGDEAMFKYRSLIKQVAKNATANVTEDDMSKIRMNVFGRSFMMFKNWIPRMIDIRASELRYNVGTETYEWGRVRMLLEMTSFNLFETFSNLSNMLRATEKGVEAMRLLYEKKQREHKAATGEDLEISEEDFYDLIRQNIRSQIREMQLLSIMVLSFMAAFKWVPPDDELWDDSQKNAWKFAQRALDKATDELSFYYNPIAFQQILNGSIFPSLGVVTDIYKIITNTFSQFFGFTVGNEKIQEKAQPTKYLMKALPVTKEMVNYIAIFYPDIAKDLGIKLSTESRVR